MRTELKDLKNLLHSKARRKVRLNKSLIKNINMGKDIKLLSLFAQQNNSNDLRGAGYSASDFPEWDNIPTLNKPYTQLLHDINKKKRIHTQSTFGALEDFNAAKKVCKTPMCTAGHLVNMAGKRGYELKNKYGWATAATLIHQKAHPDYPVQNFGAIPQEWAMAYIEDMAERENEGAK